MVCETEDVLEDDSPIINTRKDTYDENEEVIKAKKMKYYLEELREQVIE